MKRLVEFATVTACLLLGACAGQSDHFYTLNILPDGARASLTSPTVHVILSADVPALVDRPEMVLGTSDNGIAVLEHQRWAVPLSDQVRQTLARDIEMRRSDVLVADRGFDQGSAPPITIKVDIVRLIARRGGHMVMEAHWRIVDAAAGVDAIDGAAFDSPADGTDYASIAKAYSQVLSSLADKLVAAISSR